MSNLSCRYHPDALLVEDYRAGDMICSECGLVVGDRVVDVGSEWRTFSNDKSGGQAEDRSRVGASENTLLGSSDLSTTIGPARGAASFDREGNQLYNNRRNVSSSDRTLITAFRTISNMCDRLNLPRTISDRANTLFKMVHDGKNLRGRTNEAIAAASLYIACRQEGVPRTFKEIVAVSTVSKREIGRCFKLILKAHDTNVDVITTDDFMHRFCGTLGVSREVQKAATHIAKLAVELDVVPGKSPISVAAAAIYLASQASSDPKPHKMIAEIAGVAEGTIRLAYKQMLPRAAELFPKSFNFHTPIEQLPQN